MTNAEIIAVVTAAEAGKKIEMKLGGVPNDSWVPCDRAGWNFANLDYRVAREPRRIWVNFWGKTCCAYSDENMAQTMVQQGTTETAVEFVEVIK